MPPALRNLITAFVVAVLVLIAGAAQYGLDRVHEADDRNAAAHGVPGRIEGIHDCKARLLDNQGTVSTECSAVFVSDDGRIRFDTWTYSPRPFRAFLLGDHIYRDPGPLRYPYWARWTAGIIIGAAVLYFLAWLFYGAPHGPDDRYWESRYYR
ncbi:hypothetical protein AMIS_27780 [Actinoplanes missouriensis 431]|uniref:Uncharacterized protein n=1 Tax=Actinoplanes missouriensis (strain ATCC 14538 / DSM 43046 / CBS 188.64 / JCM 3121 / NBRC 102363 / NCIMB 12654 / NRRL B-3342 / UNCC 431) TaxID=512565 RepID=I0H4R1_ACTM4|nr:hypothetical protein [Actinoplanes missouriensis]BAL87998.1 hypothetical protein AMIS_27780 [Actinoplanes missouriensis 431]